MGPQSLSGARAFQSVEPEFRLAELESLSVELALPLAGRQLEERRLVALQSAVPGWAGSPDLVPVRLGRHQRHLRIHHRHYPVPLLAVPG